MHVRTESCVAAEGQRYIPTARKPREYVANDRFTVGRVRGDAGHDGTRKTRIPPARVGMHTHKTRVRVMLSLTIENIYMYIVPYLVTYAPESVSKNCVLKQLEKARLSKDPKRYIWEHVEPRTNSSPRYVWSRYRASLPA